MRKVWNWINTWVMVGNIMTTGKECQLYDWEIRDNSHLWPRTFSGCPNEGAD